MSAARPAAPRGDQDPTAGLPMVERIAARLAPAVARIVEEERRGPLSRRSLDAEIMACCHAIGRATDALVEARFTANERRARLAQERACARLHELLKRRGTI